MAAEPSGESDPVFGTDSFIQAQLTIEDKVTLHGMRRLN